MFHWLEITRYCTINLFFYSFSNSDNWLIKTLTCCGSLFSLGLDGNMYFVGNNGCNSFHCFTINFNGLFEYSNVNIKINVFDIGWDIVASYMAVWLLNLVQVAQ